MIDQDNPPTREYKLFSATTLENKYLPKDYVRQLLTYPGKWVKRYVYCSWDDFEGLVFNEFIEAKHKVHIYEPQEGDKHYIVLDYGFRNPTAILYASTDYDGITRIYNEYYEPGKLISQLTAEIKKNRFFNKSSKFIDPSTKRRERDGKSIHTEFSENGIYFLPADKDVSQGINRLNELFKDGRLFICENCENTLREIGNYKWKELKVGEEKTSMRNRLKIMIMLWIV